MNTCSYSYDGERCQEAVWRNAPDGKCVFHSGANGSDSAAAADVWNAARLMASAGDTVFHGWHFPPDENGFMGVRFAGRADFSNSVFSGVSRFLNAVFDKNAVFDGATFRGPVRWGHIRFAADLSARETVWSGGVQAGGGYVAGNADFSASRFRADAGWGGVHFNAAVNFEKAVFMRAAVFRGTHFEAQVSFSSTQFKQGAVFRDVELRNVADFSGSVFQGPCEWAGALLARGTDGLLNLVAHARPTDSCN